MLKQAVQMYHCDTNRRGGQGVFLSPVDEVLEINCAILSNITNCVNGGSFEQSIYVSLSVESFIEMQF